MDHRSAHPRDDPRRVNRPRVAGVALLALAVVLIGAAVWAAVGGGESESAGTGSIIEAIEGASPASEPFANLTETEIDVGDQRLSVVLADDDAERGQGLRERETIGEYDGMLFAYTEDAEISFTMSTVPVPLDIGFYDASGRLVNRLRMEPCAGTESVCPSYPSGGPFRYALETLAGDLPEGELRGAG